MQFLLHHYLRDSAERLPDAPAVIDRGRTATYGELDARSDQVAAVLIELGVSRGDRVGFYMDKSLESLVALYGILKVGAAYVPFDPHAPAARLGYIAANGGVRHLITGVEKAQEWARIVESGAPLESLVVLNGAPPVGSVPPGVSCMDRPAVEERVPALPAIGTIAFDLAYILYTSGSTGNPKGVMLSHQNAMAFVEWAVDELEVTPTDRLSNHAPFHFDLSIFDVFAAAKAGATLVLVPPEASFFPVDVASFIREQEISIWYSVPSILAMLTQRGGLTTGEFPTLRTLLFAGEVFPTKFLGRLMDLLPHVSFYNLYGPTETNVCTYYKVPELRADQTEPIPIGRAIKNDEVLAVTSDGLLAKPGEVGELYVRGATVMQGYWADPERTAAALVEDPLAESTAGKRDAFYRTGDLVCEQADGTYKFLGRRDHQIKSRGYRIELGDIESAMYAHQDVVECAVVAVPDELISNRIKAFAVVRNGLTRASLVRFCATRIPKYMIPESIDIWDELPKTSTGKIDRQVLRAQVIPQP